VTPILSCVSKLRGSTFTQTLVFGWLADADATLEALAQTAGALGVPISPQGLDQRFTQETAACLEQVLAAAVGQVVSADPVAIPLLARFTTVQVQDSSTITLPAALAEWTILITNAPASLLKIREALALAPARRKFANVRSFIYTASIIRCSPFSIQSHNTFVESRYVKTQQMYCAT
jgi:hypothetical protein